jgi:hypothetical protein
MLVTGRYTPQQVLQILIDSYHFQEAFDPVVLRGQEIGFGTTISEYSDICDLLGPKQLANYYHELFKLQTPLTDLQQIFIATDDNDLEVFCNYISAHAIKDAIQPITLLSQTCMTAALFRTLMFNLHKKGVKTDSVKPSSPFMPLFNKYGGTIVQEVNKLAPGALSHFEYTDNRMVRAGQGLIGIFILSIIVVPLVWQFHWALLITFVLGLFLILIGRKFKPEKEVIGGYDTVRDLIVGMQKQINKSRN